MSIGTVRILKRKDEGGPNLGPVGFGCTLFSCMVAMVRTTFVQPGHEVKVIAGSAEAITRNISLSKYTKSVMQRIARTEP